MTRDNVAKRRKVDDMSFLFCNELESICSLNVVWLKFFGGTSLEIIGLPVGSAV
jgi:hypothetical protein